MDSSEKNATEYLKGAYVNTPSKDIHVIFGSDFDSYDLSINYSQSRAGRDDYEINIDKLENLDISTNHIYLPRHFQEINIDRTVVDKKDIDLFAIEGIFAINDNEVLSYIDGSSPVLMFANLDQLEKACTLNSKDLIEYLDDLREENYYNIFIDEYKTVEDLEMSLLEELVEKEKENSLENKFSANLVDKKEVLPTLAQPTFESSAR